MVKANPRIERKKKLLERRDKGRKRIITNQETQNPSPPSVNPLKRRSPSPSLSPPPSSSLSSPEPPKPTSNSNNSGPSKTQSLSGHRSFSDSRMPECPTLPSVARNSVGQLPPLPPPPSQQLLRRTVSDPVPYGFFTPPAKIPRSTTTRDVLGPVSSGSGSVGEKSSSSRRLRRMSKKMDHMKKVLDENGNGSVSKPINTCSCCSRNDDDDAEKGKIRERGVRAERLAGDWIMIIINCPCGSDYQFMASKAEKKCYYKLA